MPTPPEDFAGRVDVLTDYALAAAERGDTLVYVRVPLPLGPLDRGAQIEDPIHLALTEAGLGSVAGGGSQLGPDDSIAYCGVDVLLTDRVRGLAALRNALRALTLPAATRIEEFLPEWSESAV